MALIPANIQDTCLSPTPDPRLASGLGCGQWALLPQACRGAGQRAQGPSPQPPSRGWYSLMGPEDKATQHSPHCAGQRAELGGVGWGVQVPYHQLRSLLASSTWARRCSLSTCTRVMAASGLWRCANWSTLCSCAWTWKCSASELTSIWGREASDPRGPLTTWSPLSRRPGLDGSSESPPPTHTQQRPLQQTPMMSWGHGASG